MFRRAYEMYAFISSLVPTVLRGNAVFDALRRTGLAGMCPNVDRRVAVSEGSAAADGLPRNTDAERQDSIPAERGNR